MCADEAAVKDQTAEYTKQSVATLQRHDTFEVCIERRRRILPLNANEYHSPTIEAESRLLSVRVQYHLSWRWTEDDVASFSADALDKFYQERRRSGYRRFRCNISISQSRNLVIPRDVLDPL